MLKYIFLSFVVKRYLWITFFYCKEKYMFYNLIKENYF